MEQFSRTALLIEESGIQKLHNARVAVFGVGGVGGYCIEALVRAGIGSIDLIDHDTVSISNLNRQIIALHSTIGQYKVDVMKQRIADINPNCHVYTHQKFFLQDNETEFPFDDYDYIVDCIDTITAKIRLVEIAEEKHIPIISSMGTGNKLDPMQFHITDIQKTSICPLARVMRRELKKRNIKHLKVIYSTEQPIDHNGEVDAITHKKTPGSMSYVPSVAGLMLAGALINDLLEEKNA